LSPARATKSPKKSSASCSIGAGTGKGEKARQRLSVKANLRKQVMPELKGALADGRKAIV